MKIKTMMVMGLLAGAIAFAKDDGEKTNAGKENGHGPWELVTPEAAFSPRDSAKGVVFKGKMWLNNGYYHGGVNIRDLWNSDDGKAWNKVPTSVATAEASPDNSVQKKILEETPYDMYAEFAAYRGKLWAVKQSVWSSPDGMKWTLVLDKGPFQSCSELFVFKEKLWALSGSSVWNTADGAEWECVAGELPFGGRGAFGFAIFDDSLWVMGGSIRKPNDPPEKGYSNKTTMNDVWRSPDGATWERVLEHAPWTPRQWFKAAAYAGKLWVFGGYDNVNAANLGDVWHTIDGKTWEQFAHKTPWTPRHEPTLFLFGGSLYMVAGNSWPVRNDVWRLTLP